MIFTWHATNAPEAVRYDDFRFIDPQVGWAINSAGQIIHTEDGFKTFTIQQTVPGDTWLRCMSFSSPTDGWVGTITRTAALVENAGWQDLGRHDAWPAGGAERGVRHLLAIEKRRLSARARNFRIEKPAS